MSPEAPAEEQAPRLERAERVSVLGVIRGVVHGDDGTATGEASEMALTRTFT